MDWKGKMTSDTRVDVNEEMSNKFVSKAITAHRKTEKRQAKEGVVHVCAYLEFLAVCACSWTRLGLIQENPDR